ncbi:hypothetical protein P280DRAFT_39658 [Massarina eburnea CBS 473.64]|uniref:Uncharacterized protein n=1 Tax=Massarina eburnea CBS 473.64 TaxID=1395130 RepID=A0A6A6S024_9PLEO|nr:hypothetical protein P280DRAFT_39658 [Massarina eburnea CBS 473.64]
MMNQVGFYGGQAGFPRRKDVRRMAKLHAATGGNAFGAGGMGIGGFNPYLPQPPYPRFSGHAPSRLFGMGGLGSYHAPNHRRVGLSSMGYGARPRGYPYRDTYRDSYTMSRYGGRGHGPLARGPYQPSRRRGYPYSRRYASHSYDDFSDDEEDDYEYDYESDDEYCRPGYRRNTSYYDDYEDEDDDDFSDDGYDLDDDDDDYHHGGRYRPRMGRCGPYRGGRYDYG